MKLEKNKKNVVFVENPRIKTQNDDIDDSFKRFFISYKSANTPPILWQNKDPSETSSDDISQYAIGGWLRWLNFINDTYDSSNEDLPAVIFRLIADDPENGLVDDNSYSDRVAYLTATKNSYKFCVNDLSNQVFDLCHSFNYTGPRENSWHFVMLMYDFDTSTYYGKIKVNGQWMEISKSNLQVGFNGYLGLYLGGDVFTEGRTGFNGQLGAWNMVYGVDFLDEYYLNTDPENIINNNQNFSHYTPIKYIDKVVQVSCTKYSQVKNSEDFFRFNYLNTFFEALDYGLGTWLKVKGSDSSNRNQIITFAFENRSEINTVGKAIAQLYLVNGDSFVEVAYEKDNELISVPQQVSNIISDEWFYIQIHFSGSNRNVACWIVQSTGTSNYEWDVTSILVPMNVFLTFGHDEVNNYNGIELEFKDAVIYAGEHVFYEVDASNGALVQTEEKHYLSSKSKNKKH